MGRPRQIQVSLNQGERDKLLSLSLSSTSEFRLVQRSKVLLMADDGATNSETAEKLCITRSTVGKILKKYALFDVDKALEDLSRSGRPRKIGMDAKSLVISLACHLPQKYEDGPKAQLWTKL